MGNRCNMIKSNKFMRRWIGLFFSIIFLHSLSACAEGSVSGTSAIDPALSQSPASSEYEMEKQESPSVQAEDSTKILVVCFSGTGTTKAVAEQIVGVTGADYFEINPTEPYSEDDLNYNNND